MKNGKRMIYRLRTTFFLSFLWLPFLLFSQTKNYPKGYFRHPLNIPMELVANFGELRSNHWHMGLDIRTQQRQNLHVYAAAEGYISRIKIEPGGFGRAIYINHPNGFTTLYAHLNNFFPALEKYVKAMQYELESWAVELEVPANLFPVSKGSFIAYSGTTGGSQGPHVHFEIRDTRTDICVNPLLFKFPIPDAVAPTVSRLALYDRNKSVFHQSPQFIGIVKKGSAYALTRSGPLKVGSDKISFAIGATDRFTSTPNPNGIYAASVYLDDELQSGFVLDSIDYFETRYLNAQIDYRYKTAGGAYVQHLSKMPGDTSDVYASMTENSVIHLNDSEVHEVRIIVKDAAQNTSVLQFDVQYDETLAKPAANNNAPQLLPNQVNVFEKDSFELFTSEFSAYDTVNITYSVTGAPGGDAVSPVFSFCNAGIPTHDSVLVRIKPSGNISQQDRDRLVIKNISGTKTVVEKVEWQGDWIAAKFRQYGTYQAFVDNTPPSVNAVATDLSKSSRIVFTPKDNFNSIKSFRAELNGQWLRFTNDKGRSHIYTFDDKFPRGTHELKVTIEDEAGNVLTKVWNVKR